MPEGIKIVLSEQQIVEMEPEEKLNTLVRIAVSNHSQIATLNEILTGNGTPEKGLCVRVSKMKTSLDKLWGVVLGGGAVMMVIIALVKFLVFEGGK